MMDVNSVGPDRTPRARRGGQGNQTLRDQTPKKYYINA